MVLGGAGFGMWWICSRGVRYTCRVGSGSSLVFERRVRRLLRGVTSLLLAGCLMLSEYKDFLEEAIYVCSRSLKVFLKKGKIITRVIRQCFFIGQIIHNFITLNFAKIP